MKNPPILPIFACLQILYIMSLAIPDHIFNSLNMSEEELLLELAVALYAAKKVSFGTARRLAGLDWYRFREILADRKVPAHY
ncbi:MAG TPA: UPF0175 family protein, partial [Anaerolineales bacterium]|nr:UPF0175 family protein [Anaerolineales bacterium]